MIWRDMPGTSHLDQPAATRCEPDAQPLPPGLLPPGLLPPGGAIPHWTCSLLATYVVVNGDHAPRPWPRPPPATAGAVG
jgi:hypothetical protein